jgi:hypothetical protein
MAVLDLDMAVLDTADGAAMAAGATVDTDAVANPEYHIVTLKHHDKLSYLFLFFLKFNTKFEIVFYPK